MLCVVTGGSAAFAGEGSLLRSNEAEMSIPSDAVVKNLTRCFTTEELGVYFPLNFSPVLIPIDIDQCCRSAVR